jgi:hypothetical protein
MILDPQNPFLNRPRHLLNQNETEKNLARYLNTVRDLVDVRAYAHELGFPRLEEDRRKFLKIPKNQEFRKLT